MSDILLSASHGSSLKSYNKFIKAIINNPILQRMTLRLAEVA